MNDEDFLIVEIGDVRGLVKDLSDLIQHYNDLKSYDEPILSPGCLLLDKLRVLFMHQDIECSIFS